MIAIVYAAKETSHLLKFSDFFVFNFFFSLENIDLLSYL